jgi:hemerythrin-like domain-containing protein
MNRTQNSTRFDALDACHRQMQENLKALVVMAERMSEGGVDAQVESQAKAIEAFFSGTSRQHHAEEELTVFPPLLESTDAALVAAVRSLQQDHGWIEENWLELAPQLRGLAGGNHWVDPAEFQHAVEVFVQLCEGHIALEESLVYPESKSRWSQAIAKRLTRPVP